MTVYIIVTTTKVHKVLCSFKAFRKEKEWLEMWV